MRVEIVRNILDANARLAAENRSLFRKSGCFVLNLMSSPGAGKTALLEEIGRRNRGRMAIGVLEGDIQTALDAERVAAAGLQAVQIETEGACHLDANMVRNGLAAFDLEALDLLVVENVGNLVCPAEFDIGENCKVMMLSVTEGEDKPAKYPLMFRESELLLLSKVDLLPHLRFDLEKVRAAARRANPRLEIIELSTYSGQGLDQFDAWLARRMARER